MAGKLGIMTAVPQEFQQLMRSFEERERWVAGGFPFHEGTFQGRPAIAVECGYGKVNAGAVATLLLHNHDCEGLIFCGVAGGLDAALGVGDVVIGRRLVMYDYGFEGPQGFKPYQPGALPFPGQPEEHGYELPEPLAGRIEAALEGLELPALSASAAGGEARQPSLRLGTIVTGDLFVSSSAKREALHRAFGALAAEMEGAAVAQVAHRFGVPAVVVRCLSDLAGEESEVSFQDFVEETSAIAALVVGRIAPAV